MIGIVVLAAASSAFGPVAWAIGPRAAILRPLRMGMADEGDAMYDAAPNTIQAEALKEKAAELEAAAAAVVSAAEAFENKNTTAFAKSWTRRLIESGSVQEGDNEFVLLEECLVDDSDLCTALEEAIKNMQQLAGKDWAGTAS